MTSKNIPRSSSSRYGLLDWAMNFPSRDHSIEFTNESGLRTLSEHSSRSSEPAAELEERTRGHFSHFKNNKKTFGAILSLLLVSIGLLTGVAFTGRRIDLSKMATALHLVADNDINPPFDDLIAVQTNCGKIFGAVDQGAFSFMGIPYALPPKGDLRWSRPVPIESSKCSKSTKIDGRKFGAKCFQINPFSKQMEGNEDCLYLNVWTPILDDSAKLPVMVYIHGGFLQFGSGSEAGLRPSGSLAGKFQAVFVSLNYRLDSFGFLALDQLANSGPNSSFGNYGLWDIVTALQWVQKNIQNFGGNANDVTLFGPDSGAAAILAIGSNSNFDHLFSKSWLIGPANYFNVSFGEVSKRNRNNFLKRSNCSTASCLRSLSSSNVAKLFLGSENDASFRINDQNDLPIQGIFPEQLIVLDGELVAGMPSSFPASSKPLLVGTAAQAIEFWPGPNDLKEWTWTMLDKYVTTSLDSFDPSLAGKVLQLYSRNESSPMSPEELYTTMVSDVRSNCIWNQILNQIRSRSEKQDQNSKSGDQITGQNSLPAKNLHLYQYLVTSKPSKPVKLYTYESSNSFHMWELLLFFDQLESLESPITGQRSNVRNPSKSELAFRDNVHKMVLNFIHGNWTQLWPSFPAVGILDSESKSKSNLEDSKPESIFKSTSKLTSESKCDFWRSKGLLDYSWVS